MGRKIDYLVSKFVVQIVTFEIVCFNQSYQWTELGQINQFAMEVAIVTKSLARHSIKTLANSKSRLDT